MNAKAQPAGKPNIILINCDDLGYGDLGCYGSQVNKTPALDRLAAEGVRFTDFYMASPVCSPSRGAMLTGCYPRRIGFGTFEGRWVLYPGQAVGLNPSEITFARLLLNAGYATKIVGKWHCGDQKEFLPTRHGFESYYGLPYSNDMGVRKKDDKFPPLPLLRDEEVIQQQPDQAALTERYVEESVRFIRANARRPFFLYLAHMHVHLPIYAPERFLKSSGNGKYGAAVECIDWAAAVIMHELKTLGLDENTLVIFTSDNGSICRGHGGSNGPLRGIKATTWEGGQRVPCIMRWPAKIPKGMVCKELAASLDFYPTFAAIGGAALPDDRIIDGKNILPLMQSAGAKSPRELFFYYMRDKLEAVRNSEWKLHVRKQDWTQAGQKEDQEIKELYNLRSDPGETRNLYSDYPEVVKELELKMDECRQDIGDEATGAQGNNTRPVGRVANPETLTHYDPSHPYMIAMYDLYKG